MKFDKSIENVVAQNLGEQQTKLVPNGYICKIESAIDKISSTNKQMIELTLEICEGEFKDYFKNSGKPCKYYQLVEGDRSISFFKGMIRAIEESNKGFKFDYYSDDNTATLVGKKIGFVFGEEGYRYNGKVIVQCKPAWARSVSKIKAGEFKIPEYKGVKPDDDNANVNDIPAPITNPLKKASTEEVIHINEKTGEIIDDLPTPDITDIDLAEEGYYTDRDDYEDCEIEPPF